MSFHKRVVSAFRPVAVQERKVSRAVVFFFLLLLMNRKPDWDRETRTFSLKHSAAFLQSVPK